MSEKRDECCLPEQSTLTSHIRTCNDDDLLRLGIKEDIVRDVTFPDWKLLFNNWMTASMNVYHVAIIDNRTDVTVLLGTLSEGKQAVELGKKRSVLLDGSDIGCQSRDETVEELCLKSKDAFLRTHYLVLVFLEFLGDVTFCLSQGLLANPVGRNLILVRVAYLEVVAKHVVVADFQALDARRLDFSLLHLQQVALALERYLAQLIEFCVHTIHDDPAIRYQQRAVRTHFASDPVTYLGTKVELLCYLS